MTDSQYPRGPSSELRPTWSRSARRLPRRIVQPLQAFLQTETSSAVLLLGATALALAWANSPWQDSYEEVWSTLLTIDVGGWSISEDLRHWVNDGLMSLFFLVVGLEIKREFLIGELRDPRAAALPVVAAVGGMVVPALIYVALNAGGEGSNGWGIPMATDIAFAVGVLTIAARNAPTNLRPFLLTLAIVDDIGAILVIALFYSGGVSAVPLLVAGVILAAILALQRFDVRATVAYVVLGLALWIAFWESGIHPTIAGVILGFVTPAQPFQRPSAVSEEAVRTAQATMDDPEPADADAPQWLRLASLSREAVSPLARVEAALHPWTSYVVVPVFALANAGIELSGEALRRSATSRVTLGVILGLVVGKVVGITGASTLAVRSGVGRLPGDPGWRRVLGVSAVAGIGFTVSLFITDLAFIEQRLADEAKIGILAGSVLASVLGFSLLRAWSRPDRRPDDAGRVG
jgi:Na+:H+ antiporter, NhaA family